MKYFWPVVVLALVLIIIFMRSCGSHGTATTTVKRDTTYVHDTTLIKTYQPVAYEILKPGASQPITPPHMVFIDFTKPVDTMAILEDYFARRMYTDTLRNKYGYVVVHDTITQNKIWARSADFNLSVPQVTTTITEAKRKGFIGFDLGIGNGLAMGGLQFTYIDRKDNMFHIRTDFTTMGNLFFGGGVDWKISLFKK